MKPLARRKIVFVIVEGASDDTALGISLNQVFDKESVYIHIMHGDITTRTGVDSQNIVSKVGNEVKAYAAANHYKLLILSRLSILLIQMQLIFLMIKFLRI